MTGITHHIPEALIRAHATGNLPHAFGVVVAAHLSMCDACRALSEAEEAVGGVLLDRLLPADLAPGALDRLMAALEAPDPFPPAPRRSGIYPAPVAAALGGEAPRWRALGGGIRQQILSADRAGSLRLLSIPPGAAVPEHGHRGLELTLVLQGSFADSGGRFGVGDVEVASDAVDHQPVAGEGATCICLAATDAPLRFHGLIPRLLQPVFRI